MYLNRYNTTVLYIQMYTPFPDHNFGAQSMILLKHHWWGRKALVLTNQAFRPAFEASAAGGECRGCMAFGDHGNKRLSSCHS